MAVGKHRQGEIGFMFDPDHQGHGYATEAAGRCSRSHSRATACIASAAASEARNAASARVLEKLGMRREARLIENEWVKGEWRSEAVYAMLAREWRAARERR